MKLLFPQQCLIGQEGMASSCAGEVHAGCKEKLVFRESAKELKWAVQGGSGVAVPGGIQKTCGCVRDLVIGK